MRSECCSDQLTWFNKCKYPSIQIGPFSFRLFVLPIVASLLFLLDKRYSLFVSLGLPQTTAPIPPLDQEIGGKREKGHISDTENQIPLREDRPVTHWHKWVKRMVWFYRMGWTWQQGILLDATHRRSQMFSPRATAVEEALSLLLAACVSDQKPRRACFVTILGWAAWGAQNWVQENAGIYASTGYVLAAMPTMWLLGGEDKALSFLSGFALATLAIDPHISTKSSLRRAIWFERYLWPLGLIAAVALAKEIYHAVSRGLESDSTIGYELSRLLYATFAFSRTDIADLGRSLLAAISPLAAVVAAGLVTGFLSSCLAWKWAVLSEAASAPTYGPALLLTFIINYYAFGIILWAKRGDYHNSTRPVPTRKICLWAFEAAGYTTVLCTSIWMLLMANKGVVC